MDHVYFLKDRLRLLTYFYEQSAAPFKEIQRKIEAHDPPYDEPTEYSEDEPPFLEEFMQAEQALNLLGMVCLDLLVGSFHAFLDDFRTTNWRTEALPDVKGGWFERYKQFFDVDGYRWEDSGADIEFLRQAVLTRNDHQHERLLFSVYVKRSEYHKKLAPDSAFIHGLMGELGMMEVTPDHFQKLQQEIVTLATYLQEAYFN